MKRTVLIAAALALQGCAATYDLTLMPRDSGKTYAGTVVDDASGEGRVAITIEGKAYTGTWVQSAPASTRGWVTGGMGWGRRGGFGGLGTTITLENPQGNEAKALLSAPDGSGLRCDFKSGQGRGFGLCRDDGGREYDVQIRPASNKSPR
jgi:hypothetical protein